MMTLDERHMMTLDEVVAANVRRIRKERGWSVVELANRLGVTPHRVCDYERARSGHEQRAFSWVELVALCLALRTTLFDLVLPPAEVELDLYYFKGFLGRTDPVDEMDDRTRLGWDVFGVGWALFARLVSEEEVVRRITKSLLWDKRDRWDDMEREA